MQTIRRWTAAALVAASLDATAGQYTDLWWNPQESGWGANIVHQGDTAFVTMFHYGRDGSPAWLVASDARTYAIDSAGRPALRGTLYRTSGPGMEGPYDPTKVRIERVGTLHIEPRAEGGLNLSYAVDGVQVSKDVVRMTFSVPEIASNYHGTFILRQAVPGEGPHATRRYAADLSVQVDAGQVTLRQVTDAGHCEYGGSLSPSGKLAYIAGRYTCDGGVAGTFAISDLEVSQHAISGYLRMDSPQLNQYGRFAAARY
jgi:hypothetical protein